MFKKEDLKDKTALNSLQNYYEAQKILINVTIMLQDKSEIFLEEENNFGNETNLILRDYLSIKCEDMSKRMQRSFGFTLYECYRLFTKTLTIQ